MSVFISYRKEDGKVLAKKTYDVLNRHYEVFLDDESLTSGKFNSQIIEKIKECDDFVIILTEKYFERYATKDDWAEKELALAIQEGKNIIPITDRKISDLDFEKTPIAEYQIFKFNQNKWQNSITTRLTKIKLSGIFEQGKFKLSSDSIEALKRYYRYKVEKEDTPITLESLDVEINYDGLSNEEKYFIIHERHIHAKYYKRAVEMMISESLEDSNMLPWSRVNNLYTDVVDGFFEAEDETPITYDAVKQWAVITESLITTLLLGKLAFINEDETLVACIAPNYAWYFKVGVKKLPERLRLFNDSVTVIDMDPCEVLEKIMPKYYYELVAYPPKKGYERVCKCIFIFDIKKD